MNSSCSNRLHILNQIEILSQNAFWTVKNGTGQGLRKSQPAGQRSIRSTLDQKSIWHNRPVYFNRTKINLNRSNQSNQSTNRFTESTELTESLASHRCRSPATTAEGGGVLPESWPTATAEAISGSGGAAAEDGGGRRRTRFPVAARRVYALSRRNFWRRVRLRLSSDCGVVGVYGFVSTRGTRWWSFMHEILNG